MKRSILLVAILTLQSLIAYYTLEAPGLYLGTESDFSCIDFVMQCVMALGVSITTVALSRGAMRYMMQGKHIIMRGIVAAAISLAVLICFVYGISCAGCLISGNNYIAEAFNLVIWGFIALLEFTFVLWLCIAETLAEQQRLLHIAEQRKLQILQNQMHPHFLFNSLSALTGYIDDNPKEAKAFVTAISQMYRTMLDNLQQELIDLRDELILIRSYAYIQKHRFNDGLSITLPANDQLPEGCIPPFALQTLVENAIKHNIHSTKRPLRIVVKCEGDDIIVSNNLQPLQGVQKSKGLGLTYLREQYKMLNVAVPTILQDKHNFTVSIKIVR